MFEIHIRKHDIAASENMVSENMDCKCDFFMPRNIIISIHLYLLCVYVCIFCVYMYVLFPCIYV